MTEGPTSGLLATRLRTGETLGDRIMKVDHAGEHGAICIYTAQRWIARWRAPSMVAELSMFLAHEREHRALFQAQLEARGRPRCRSYHLCALGGVSLGLITGLMGRRAIAATTVAIERIVLNHLAEQLNALRDTDPPAAATIQRIIADEQEHLDRSSARIAGTLFDRTIDRIVAFSTEAIIWLGMRL